jgi:cation diffusion facilitator CzcD-associated flavoprotein CzcO
MPFGMRMMGNGYCLSNRQHRKRDIQSRQDVFVNAGGILNNWKWPDIEGLASFEGLAIHTASWVRCPFPRSCNCSANEGGVQDSNFDWTDKKVAVIGSGATSVQVVPQLQPLARRLEVFVRSPTYIIPRVGFGVQSSTFNEPCEFPVAFIIRSLSDSM